LAETKVTTGQNHCVFHDCEADDALALRFILVICHRVILPVNVRQFKDVLIVKKFLLDELKSEGAISFKGKDAIGKMNRLFGSPFVGGWENGFNR